MKFLKKILKSEPETQKYAEGVPRIDYKYLVAQLGGFVNFEKGFFYTLKELLFRPRKTLKDYIYGYNRNKLTKPLSFLFFISFIYTIITLKIFPILNPKMENKFVLRNLGHNNIEIFFNEYAGLKYLFITFIYSCLARLLFYKSEYNYYEIYTSIIYVYSSLLLVLFLPNHIFDHYFGILPQHYFAWFYLIIIALKTSTIFNNKISAFILNFISILLAVFLFNIISLAIEYYFF